MNDERNDDARPVERSWRQLILGGFVALLGLALLVFLLYSLARDVSLWVFGTETTAEVDELWVERTSPEDAEELTFDYHVSYHFTTPNGRTLHNASTLDVREWGALKVGGPVDVVYFAPYPAHNRLEEGRYVTVLACAYVPLFLAAWALLGGAVYLVRPGSQREWWFASGRWDP